MTTGFEPNIVRLKNLSLRPAEGEVNTRYFFEDERQTWFYANNIWIQDMPTIPIFQRPDVFAGKKKLNSTVPPELLMLNVNNPTNNPALEDLVVQMPANRILQATVTVATDTGTLHLHIVPSIGIINFNGGIISGAGMGVVTVSKINNSDSTVTFILIAPVVAGDTVWWHITDSNWISGSGKYI